LATRRTVRERKTTMVPKSILTTQRDALLEKRLVRIQFLDKCLAGIPKGGDALEYYISKKFLSDDEKKAFRERVKAGSLSPQEEEEVKQASERVFERDGGGEVDRGVPVLWHGQLKAMLRDVFTCMGLTQRQFKQSKTNGHAGGKQILQHTVNVEPNHLRFLDGTTVVPKPDGIVDRVVHTQNGSALSSHEFMFQREMEFTLSWPKNSCFTDDDIKNALSLCENDGLGACRSQGFGRFAVTKYDTV